MHHKKAVLTSLATMFAVTVIVPVAATGQSFPRPESKLQSGLPADQITFLHDSRNKALQEISADPHQLPEVAAVLGRDVRLAVAQTVRVELPKEKGNPYRSVTLRLEETWRGPTDRTEITLDSLWVPPPPAHPELAWIDSSSKMLILAGSAVSYSSFNRDEPRVGRRFLIAYTLMWSGNKQWPYLQGALDLDDAEQVKFLSDIQRFLSIEARAGEYATGPFVAALSDRVPWIRDLAAQRLVQSDVCNASPECKKAWFREVRDLLHSGTVGNRWEAVHWLEWLSLPIGERKSGPNGLPPMATPQVQELLRAILADSNLAVGDYAYNDLEWFEFHQSAKPGDCIEIVSALRKSARWTQEELKGKSIGGPLGHSLGCIPEK